MTGIVTIIRDAIAMFTALFILLGAAVNPEISPFIPEDYTEEVSEVECMTIIENGASDYVIVCGKAAGNSEYTAALKLQGYLKQMSGVELPIVSDTTAAIDTEIIVGKTNREGTDYTVDRASFTDDTVNVFTVGRKLVIAGAEKRGTLYGVFEFLKQCLGCRWYAHDLVIVPSNATVDIPVEINIKKTSPLEYRETDWISPRNVEYSLANKLNSNIYRHLSVENGDYVGYAGGFAHTLSTSFCASSKYMTLHPEYYAIHDGVRKGNQLCLTNPDVVDIVIDEVKAILKDNPDRIVSLTQHDNQDYCECKNCKALDEYEGSHAGTMITFVNKIAAAIKDEYPNAAIDTFAYQYTRTPPKYVKPLDNVIVRLCSIECCFSHPLNDSSCERNVDFAADLVGWSEICNRLYVWDYTTNYSHYSGPFPNFNVMQKNMQFFTENHVVGLYEEGNYTAGVCDTEFAEYRAYLLSCLMWDPYCNLERESDGFLKAYYGKGWEYVKEYVRFTSDEAGKSGDMSIYNSMDNDGILDLTKNEIQYLDDLWAKAKELADNDTILENVERSEVSWRYWKGCNKVDEFSRTGNVGGWKDENKKLYEDLRRFGVTMLREGRNITDSPNFEGVPSDWRG